MPRAISDEDRGCGNLKEGGTYLQGTSFSPGGKLAPWTWVLGEGIIGGSNLALKIPPRQTGLIHLPATIQNGHLSTGPETVLPIGVPLNRLPVVALVDHVGSSHYTPIQFAQECAGRGPSRRVSPELAEQVAGHLPMPILFSHGNMPYVDRSIVDDLATWLEANEDVTFGRTYDDPKWGIYSGDHKGDDHFIAFLLRRLHEQGRGRNRPGLLQMMPREWAENILWGEQAFGISWILGAVYVIAEGDSDAKLNQIASMGIEPVIPEKARE